MNELLNNILSAVAFVGVFSGIVVQVIKNAELVNKRYLPLVSSDWVWLWDISWRLVFTKTSLHSLLRVHRWGNC